MGPARMKAAATRAAAKPAAKTTARRRSLVMSTSDLAASRAVTFSSFVRQPMAVRGQPRPAPATRPRTTRTRPAPAAAAMAAATTATQAKATAPTATGTGTGTGTAPATATKAPRPVVSVRATNSTRPVRAVVLRRGRSATAASASQVQTTRNGAGSDGTNGRAPASLEERKAKAKMKKMLRGVCAVVDVRVGESAQIDCSDVVARKLKQMGATVVTRYSPRLTHLVVSHLTLMWKDKIAKWQTWSLTGRPNVKLEIVSQLWVNACFVNQQRMPEGSFFPVHKGESLAIMSTTATKPKAGKANSAGTDAPPQGKEMGTLVSTVVTVTASTTTAATAPPTTKLPASTSVSAEPLTKSRTSKLLARKRRAQSMEPMASDTIAKLLGTEAKPFEMKELDTNTQQGGVSMTTEEKLPKLDADVVSRVSTRRNSAALAKRRRTIATLPLIESSQVADSESKRDDCVSDSCSDDETTNASSVTSVTTSSSTQLSGVPTSQISEIPLNASTSTQKEPAAETDASAPTESTMTAMMSTSSDTTVGPANNDTTMMTTTRDTTLVSSTSDTTVVPSTSNTTVVSSTSDTTVESSTSDTTVVPSNSDTTVVTTPPAAAKSPKAVTQHPQEKTLETAPTGAESILTATATSEEWACSDSHSLKSATRRTCKGRGGTEITASALEPEAVVSATPTDENAQANEEPAGDMPSPMAAKGDWACSICNCINPKSQRLCSGCKTSKIAAKKSIVEATPTKKISAYKPPPPPTPTRRLRDTHQTPPTRSSAPLTPAKKIDANKLPASTPTRRTTNTAQSNPTTPLVAPQHRLAGSMVKPTRGLDTVLPGKSAGKRRRLASVSSTSNEETSAQSKHLDSSAEKRVATELATPQRPLKKSRTSQAVSGSSSSSSLVLQFSKSPRKQRAVIGITGVDTETRGVLECAVHAIDANMSGDNGYRKARVVKSVDYAAGITHLVVGGIPKRTIKVLFAIARGAWIVSEAWVFSSLEQERWLPEDDFELEMFSNRIARQHPEHRAIFRSMKFFVGSNVEPSKEVVISLIQSAGGEIVNQISVASICICGDGSLFRRAQRADISVVPAKWVFDSIAGMKLEDASKYFESSTIEESVAA